MKRILIIVSISFGLLVIINPIIFSVMLPNQALVVSTLISLLTSTILSVFIALQYSFLNKSNSENRKKIGYYLKKIWGIIALIILFSIGISLAGGIMTYFTVILLKNSIGNTFFGAIFTVPLFIIYLIAIYKNFVKLGFLDCSKQLFNKQFKILTLLLLLIFIMPSTIMDNIYSVYTYHYTTNPLESAINIRAVFSFNIDLSLSEDFGSVKSNSGQNMILIMLKVILTLSIEMAVAIFAYMRGKTIFTIQHLKIDRDYQTDQY